MSLAIDQWGNTSGFSPLSIAGLQLWLKADAIVGLNDGDPVATWSDSSGLGHDVTQGTPAARPLYKTAIRNGLPVVRFDGTDDTLAVAGLGARAAQTVFAVAVKRSAPDATNRSLWDISGGNATIKANSALHATLWLWQFNQAGSRTALTAATAANWLVLSTVVASASSLTNYVNGASGTTLDPNNAVTTGTGFTLASPAGDVDIAELAIYDTALSDANRALVETYLLAKWGLP